MHHAVIFSWSSRERLHSTIIIKKDTLLKLLLCELFSALITDVTISAIEENDI